MSTYSCKKATEMVEKQHAFGLSIAEKLTLKLHVTICKACRGYQKQSNLIDAFLGRQENNKNMNSIENNELKASIIAHLKNQ